jgi:hypothetical protein
MITGHNLLFHFGRQFLIVVILGLCADKSAFSISTLEIESRKISKKDTAFEMDPRLDLKTGFWGPKNVGMKTDAETSPTPPCREGWWPAGRRPCGHARHTGASPDQV